MSNNRTIPLAELSSWAELCRDPARRDAAVEEMVKHISKSAKKRTSLTPRMMVTACSLGEARFRRVPAKQRAERCFNSLCEFYRALIRPKLISPHIVARLRALSKFATENRILNIRKQPSLFLPCSNDLRISIPPCFIARVNGKRILIVLSYNDVFPLHDGAHLTAAGKTALGGLSLVFEKDRLRGSSKEVFALPSYVEGVLVVDVSRAKWKQGARIIGLNAQDLFLAPLRLDFLAKQAAVGLLYSDACKKLGIDDGGHDAGDEAPSQPDRVHSAKPIRKSA